MRYDRSDSSPTRSPSVPERAEADRAWVEGYLLDALEQAGARCLSEAAFALGVPRIVEFERAIKQSQRTLLVLSPAYLTDTFNQFADLLVQSYGVQTATWPLIPLVLRPIVLPARLAMLHPLDATDMERWQSVVQRLCSEMQRPTPGLSPKPPCPYPGMVPFRAEDAAFFHGREAEIQQIAQRLRHQRQLWVIGPSGSEKSSLIYAGLLPYLAESGLFPPNYWRVRTMRPGRQPLVRLRAVLADALRSARPRGANVEQASAVTQASESQVLLVIDQFEEAFTLASREQRHAFEDALRVLRGTKACTLVVMLRADFFPDLMNSGFWPVDSSQRIEIAPLRGDSLRAAIELPATEVGVYLEPELVERLLADAADEPGVLPLLQETLVLLWVRMSRRLLTRAAYTELSRDGRSGIAVAIATRADSTLAMLTPQQQVIARRIFLRLIQFGDGRADTRRQQSVATLQVAGDDPAQFEATLRALIENRLLTVGGADASVDRRVDIAHEALIAGWPALRQWLTERRGTELTRRRLEGQAAEWLRLGRGVGGLFDGMELAEAERWRASDDAADLGVSDDLHTLVVASRAELLARERQQEMVRRRELEQAQALAEEQRQRAAEQALTSRRLRRRAVLLAGTLACALIAAVAAGWFGVRAQSSAAQVDRARATAVAERDRAEAERDRAEQGERLARINELVAQAQATRADFSQRSLLLATEALSLTKQSEASLVAAEQSLRDSLSVASGRSLGRHAEPLQTVAFSPNSTWLVTASSDRQSDPKGALLLWRIGLDGAIGNSIRLDTGGIGVTSIVFSPDSRKLVAARSSSSAAVTWLWDLSNLAGAVPLRRFDFDLSNQSLSNPSQVFSPDSRWLLLAGRGQERPIQVVDLDAGLSTPPQVLEHAYGLAVFSSDNRWLLTGGELKQLLL